MAQSVPYASKEGGPMALDTAELASHNAKNAGTAA